MVGSWISLDDTLKFFFSHVREKANNIDLRFLRILFFVANWLVETKFWIRGALRLVF